MCTLTNNHVPCFACHRGVSAKRPRLGRFGKAKVRHKCPHGVWCISGRPEGAQGFNYAPTMGPARCLECYWAKREREEIQRRTRVHE